MDQGRLHQKEEWVAMPLAGTETERGGHSPYDPGKEFQLCSSQVLSFSFTRPQN